MGRAYRLVLVAAVLALTGCAGVPTAGPVRVVRHVPAEGPDLPEPRVVRVVPSGPKPDATPEEIVRGYLTAQADAQNDHGIARKYLATGVRWNPDARVTIYGNPRIGAASVSGDTSTVAAVVDQAGTINATGGFQPAASTAASTVTFGLRRIAGTGWRVVTAPTGVLLTRSEVSGLYQRVTLYWPDQARRRLVPDPVFLPSTDQPIATVVRTLLAGPKGWLAPAVRSAIPNGTELLEPPTLVDGVVSLNFSREIRRAPQETLGALVAQVVWTLSDTPFGVRAVRVSAEGDAITVSGHPQKEQRRVDWAEYAPVPPAADGRLFFVRDGLAYASDDAGRVSRVGGSAPPLVSVSANRAGTVLAAVTEPSGGRQSLQLMSPTDSTAPRTVLSGDRISVPTWEPSGTALWVVVASRGAEQVFVVPTGSSGSAASAVPPPVHGPVSWLRVSADGARALLVAGAGAAAKAFVARVEYPASGGRVLTDARQLAPSVTGVTAVAFDDANEVFLATLSAGRPALYRVALDGYDLVRVRDDGLPSAPVGAVAVSAPDSVGAPVDRVLAVGGRLWRRTPGASWAPLPGRGSAASYAG